MVKPTARELLKYYYDDYSGDPAYEEVSSIKDSDDHGYSCCNTYKRFSDNTFWEVSFVVQDGGNYNSFSDDPDTITVYQVYPHIVTTTVYKTTP